MTNGQTVQEHAVVKETILQKVTSCRWKLMYMLHLANASLAALEVCMSFALVCMSPRIPADDRLGGLNGTSESLWNASILPDNKTMIKYEFDWSTELQGLIISSISYLGIISSFLAGWLSKRFSFKRLLLISMVLAGVISLCTPLIARTSPYLLIVSQMSLGFFTGMVVPFCQCFISKWSTNQERVLMIGMYIGGLNSGSITAFLFSGIICTIQLDNGWPFIFYVFGGLNMVWCVCWAVFFHDTPEVHPRISAQELQFIQQDNIPVAQEKIKIPWRSILTSWPVLALCLLTLSHGWTSSVVFNYLPRYLSDVLHFQVSENGILSSLPLISRFIGVFFWSNFSSFLQKYFSITIVRKTIQSSGFLLAVSAMLAIAYCNSDQPSLIVGLFIMLTFCQVCTTSVVLVNTFYLAPSSANILTAMVMTSTNIAFLLSPLATGYIVVDGTVEQWKTVLLLNAGCLVAGVVVFCLLGDGEVQIWAKKQNRSTVKNEANGLDVTTNAVPVIYNTTPNIEQIEKGKPIQYAVTPDSKPIQYAVTPDSKPIQYAVTPDSKPIQYAVTPNSKPIQYAVTPDSKPIQYAVTPDSKPIQYAVTPDSKEISHESVDELTNYWKYNVAFINDQCINVDFENNKICTRL